MASNKTSCPKCGANKTLLMACSACGFSEKPESKCPKCGEPKSLLMACQSCGYSKRKAQMKKHKSQECPRCGAFATKEHIQRKDCKRRTSQISGLPDYDKLRSENDVFSRGLVRSGGGFGVGKKKRK